MRNSIRNTLGGLLLSTALLTSNAPRAEASTDPVYSTMGFATSSPAHPLETQPVHSASQPAQRTHQYSEAEGLLFGLAILGLGTLAIVRLGTLVELKAKGYDSKHPYQI